MALASVTVRVPASTSNLGSGFDTLGLAVRWHNELTFHRLKSVEMSPAWRMNAEDAVWFETVFQKAARLFFKTTGSRKFGCRIELVEKVPMARGLGASATIRVGVLAGLNELAGAPLSRAELLGLATELEGHPDNASPAIHGGFTVSSRVGSEVRCLSFGVAPRLQMVTLIPRFGISTDEARRLLPSTYAKADAVHALNRASLITAAFAQGQYSMLSGVFDDRIHQPYREKLLPSLRRVIRAGVEAGALGGFLSGSGSCIICLTLKSATEVGRAMLRVLPKVEVRVLRADNEGLVITKRRRA